MEKPKVHELKCKLGFFQPLLEDKKTFEVRKDDRKFTVGDFLNILEYDQSINKYTGRNVTFIISYKLDAATFPEGIKEGYCILGIKH